MRTFVLALIGFCHVACNYDDGQCYVRGQGGSAGVGAAAGGGVIIPAGAGGFGDSPKPKPQGSDDSVSPPACLSANSTCEKACLSTYEADYAFCGDDPTCQAQAYEVYQTCRGKCAVEAAKEQDWVCAGYVACSRAEDGKGDGCSWAGEEFPGWFDCDNGGNDCQESLAEACEQVLHEGQGGSWLCDASGLTCVRKSKDKPN